MSSLIITKQTGNFFSLVLDGGDPIISEQNRLTTIGNYCNFKTANGANLILKQNILYSEVTIGSHVATSIYDLWVSLVNYGFFIGLGTGGSSGSGAINFTELLDTFPSYLGRNGQVLVVNESMQKINTVDISLFTPEEKAKLEGIETGAQKNVQANLAQTDPEANDFVKGQQDYFLNSVGSFNYSDLATQTTPISVLANTPTKLTNDAQGTFTIMDYAPYGVPTIYEASVNQFDFSALSLGDQVAFRTDLDIDLVGTNTSYTLELRCAVGTANAWSLPVHNGERKSTANFKETHEFSIVMEYPFTIDNPAELWLTTDANASVKVNGWQCKVLRKNINLVEIALNGETTTTLGTLINSAENAVPNDTDFVATAEAGGLLKKISWTNVKNFLKTYLVSDTSYNSASWDGVTDVAPSKNAVRDVLESKQDKITGLTINFIPKANGSGGFSNSKFIELNGNIGLGSVTTPGELLHIGDGNMLLEGGGEVAQKFKRDFTTTGTNLGVPTGSGQSVNPIFQIGRIIQAGDGDPEIRVMYSDDNTSERTVFEVDRKGIVASVKTGSGSHFEGFASLTDVNPMFRLNSYPRMRLEMGDGGNTVTDVALERSYTGGLDFFTNNINRGGFNNQGDLVLNGTVKASPATADDQMPNWGQVKAITVNKISGTKTLSDADNGKVFILIANCVVTIPNGLVNGFNATFRTLTGATYSQALGGAVTIIGNTGFTMPEKSSFTMVNTGVTNEYLYTGAI